ncbi:transposase [Paenibacillus thiaminolyticus]|nr:hypothetical protein [Paenibacillus thiaminolyticus]WCR29910.1 transposase [Paenibacillus thiaminolyticus]
MVADRDWNASLNIKKGRIANVSLIL